MRGIWAFWILFVLRRALPYTTPGCGRRRLYVIVSWTLPSQMRRLREWNQCGLPQRPARKEHKDVMTGTGPISPPSAELGRECPAQGTPAQLQECLCRLNIRVVRICHLPIGVCFEIPFLSFNRRARLRRMAVNERTSFVVLCERGA